MCPKVGSMSPSKQGNSDVNSPWAIARLAWARQLAVRLGIWSWPSSLVQTPPSMNLSNLTALNLAQIVVWDETHKGVKIGQYGPGGSKRQVRFPRDKNGLVDCANGEYGPRSTYLKAKYPGQARFSFGCAIVETVDGQQGRRCTPFIYSGKWIHTLEEYNALQNQEILYCSPWVVKRSAKSNGKYFFTTNKHCTSIYFTIFLKW
jgi:hypothetical protein